MRALFAMRAKHLNVSRFVSSSSFYPPRPPSRAPRFDHAPQGHGVGPMRARSPGAAVTQMSLRGSVSAAAHSSGWTPDTCVSAQISAQNKWPHDLLFLSLSPFLSFSLSLSLPPERLLCNKKVGVLVAVVFRKGETERASLASCSVHIQLFRKKKKKKEKEKSQSQRSVSNGSMWALLRL